MAGDITNWYQSHGFDTEPGWAMLVVNETRFQSELLSKGTKFEVQSIPGCQENTLVML
jgi:hypothetical protein